MSRHCLAIATLTLLLALSSTSAASSWPSDGSFLVGSSWRADMQRLDVLQAMGATHARLYAHFAYVVPLLSDVDPSLTVAEVDANFEQQSQWLNQQANWKMMDESVLQRGGASVIRAEREGTHAEAFAALFRLPATSQPS